MEITHAYHGNEEAKTLLGKENASKTFCSSRFLGEVNLQERVERLIKEETEKAKGYQENLQTSLLIRVASPLAEKNNYKSTRPFK